MDWGFGLRKVHLVHDHDDEEDDDDEGIEGLFMVMVRKGVDL